MAWRETRASWRHFLYFFICIALGVGSLVGVALFAANVEQAVTREARGLMGGDLEVRMSRPISEQGLAVLQSLAPRGIVMTHASELVTMAAVTGAGGPFKTQIVELKAVEAEYPFYGTLKVGPARPLAQLLSPSDSLCGISPHASRLTAHAACYGAVVQESLLIQMGVSVGDRLKIGQATFTITGVIRREPDRIANAFSLGPRVMISREGLTAADLVKPGSRVRERYLLRLPPALPAQTLVYELRGRLAGESARVTTYRDAQPQLKQFLDQLTRYLGLIGLTALFVGGIGIATTVQTFVREKLHTIAILKTLGADSSGVVTIYLLQAIVLGTIGSFAGAALGIALQGMLPPLLSGIFASNVLDQIEFTASLSHASLLPFLKGMALGILTTLLFTLWPLLGVREVRPALIFRREMAPASMQASAPWARRSGRGRAPWTFDRVRVFTAVGITIGLAGLSIWQAGSGKIGLLFLGALAAAMTALLMAALLLIHVLKLVPHPRSLSLRQAVRNLHRPGSQAAGLMVSVGIGVMLIVAVSLIERSLVHQIGESRPTEAPTFFFIDIQPDQRDIFQQVIQRVTGGQVPDLTPLVRSRLQGINGQAVRVDEDGAQEGEQKPEGRKNWYLTREYVLTFLPRVPKDNTILKGTWWQPGEAPSKAFVSIEEEAARNLGVDLGSSIQFDIQGTIVSAEVRSIRKVEWGNFSTNFYMILSPGALEGAPFTYVGTVRVSPAEEVPLQQAVVAAFPNVTAINIGDVMDAFAKILERLSLAIRAIAVFCVLAGAIVMAAALASTRYRRLYESVILKALGATRGLIARAFAAEYALLGATAGLIGMVLASALSWGILFFILDLPWTLQPDILASGLVLSVLLTLAVGFLSTFRILGQYPFAVLRHE
jgi:putative ABC transport system permease protein